MIKGKRVLFFGWARLSRRLSEQAVLHRSPVDNISLSLTTRGLKAYLIFSTIYLIFAKKIKFSNTWDSLLC